VEVADLVEKVEKEILTKNKDELSHDELSLLLEYLAYREHEIFYNKELIKGVNHLYDCVNNFKRPPVIDVSSEAMMQEFYEKVIELDDRQPFYKLQDVDVYNVADKIQFVNDYGYFIQVLEKDGKISGYEHPVIDITQKDMKRISSQVWNAIFGLNLLPRIFQYQGQIFRLVFINGQLKNKLVNKHDMLHIMETAADFIKVNKNGDKVPAHPTQAMAEYMLATPDPPLPALEGIKTNPYFAADGELIFTPGYREKTKIFLHDLKNINGPNLKYLTLDEALRLIRDDILVDFPFVSDSDFAHAVALLIQPLIRHMIDGPTPLFIIKSPTIGTGKTLLAETLTLISTGKDANLQVLPVNDSEVRKRVTAKLMQYPAHFIFDNVRHKVDSASLASALTARSWEDRILSKSKTGVFPVNCTWVLTGNNVTCSSEITRRSIRIHMDTRSEMPWLNRKFNHKDLIGFIKKNIDQCLWAAITLVQNWVREGMPKFSGKPLGKYESWTMITGGILEAAGIKGFMQGITDFYQDVDDDTSELKAVVYLWNEKFGVQPVLASDLVVVDQMPITDSRKMGAFLKSNRNKRVILKDESGRIVDDFIIRKVGTVQKKTKWRLEKFNVDHTVDHTKVIHMQKNE
jgi:putative DNA primase/helicase